MVLCTYTYNICTTVHIHTYIPIKIWIWCSMQRSERVWVSPAGRVGPGIINYKWALARTYSITTENKIESSVGFGLGSETATIGLEKGSGWTAWFFRARVGSWLHKFFRVSRWMRADLWLSVRFCLHIITILYYMRCLKVEGLCTIL